MKYLTETEARRFAEAWLPAWTGNNAEHLASFYSDDAFYLDPAIPEGVKGKPALIAYFIIYPVMSVIPQLNKFGETNHGGS